MENSKAGFLLMVLLYTLYQVYTYVLEKGWRGLRLYETTKSALLDINTAKNVLFVVYSLSPSDLSPKWRLLLIRGSHVLTGL